MELRKIILSGERQLTEAQQKLSRFIMINTEIPFTGETFADWQKWVDLNKPYAEEQALKKQQPKQTPKRRKTNPLHKGNRTVVMDYDALKAIVKASPKTMAMVNYSLGQNSSYLAARASKYGGEIPQSFVGQICDLLGCDPSDFVPELRTEVKQPDLIEQAEQAEIVSTYTETTISNTDGEPIVTVHAPIPLVGIPITDRLRGYCLFTGRGMEETAIEALDAFLDTEMMLMGRDPKEARHADQH